MRLVEEEDELGLVGVADLGQVVEEVGEQPHEEGREERGAVLHGRQLEAGDDAAAVRRGAQQLARVELGLAEERLGALVGEADELAQDDAGRRRRQAAEGLQVGLAVVGGEVLHDLAQVLEVDERQPLLVGVVEDEPEAGLLGVVEAEDLAQQVGPNEVMVARTGTPLPWPPSERNSTG